MSENNNDNKPYATNKDRYDNKNGASYFIYKYENKSSKGYLGNGDLENEKVTLGDIREYVVNSDVYLNNQEELEKKNKELEKKNKELEEIKEELEKIKIDKVDTENNFTSARMQNIAYEEKIREQQELLEKLLEFSKKADYYYNANETKEYNIYMADPNNENKLNVIPKNGQVNARDYYFNYRIVNNNNEKIKIGDLNMSNLINLKDARIVLEATKV